MELPEIDYGRCRQRRGNRHEISGMRLEVGKTYYAERGVNARKERQHAIVDKATREKTKREFGLTDSPPPPTES